MEINNYDYLGQQMDVSKYFYQIGNTYFNVQDMVEFDEKTLSGLIKFNRYERKGRMAFNQYTCPFEESQSWSFPPDYAEHPAHPVRFSFISSNIFRIQADCAGVEQEKEDSVMVEAIQEYHDYTIEKKENRVELRTSELHVTIQFQPFGIIVRDKSEKILTKTLIMGDGKSLLNSNPLPFSYVKTPIDMRKYIATSFLIHPDEHFYGAGESFTKLDKIGQKVVLWTKDANGVETQDMYKPVPFYMSSRGYGIFTHTSAPVTFDFGYSYQEAQTIFIGEEKFDLFLISGNPKEILASYTSLTGRSEVPPLWSFGLWMSRITYDSEEQVRDVICKMKEFHIPCDVIHLDTGWFEYDWRCDYEFSKSRFTDPIRMIKDLKKDGYHVSLWQIPYFTPNNKYFKELIEKEYTVKGQEGTLATDDAILDFTNPNAVLWYQEKLKSLLEIGVDAIKVDFGEAAPLHGRYHNGKSGILEHNLYPLRYNKAVAEVTKRETKESIIWARSAWAGSQRYPLHWGGDAENTNMGMLSSLRGGLSLGICGFSFWSHDAGGFVKESPEELYGRWMFMAIFTSHIRCHGAPPKEPWCYSDKFLELFRTQVSVRYRLMPYIYAQAKKSASLGLPVMRSMFLEFPEDRNCYGIETQYMFGEDILVAPIFETGEESREVYLPKGRWMNLQNSQEVLDGGQWYIVQKGPLDGIAFVSYDSVIPMVDCAKNTESINWETLCYCWFTKDKKEMKGTGIDRKEKFIFDITTEEMKSEKLVLFESLW